MPRFSAPSALRLLCLGLWVGSLVFFAFVLAPVAFHVLPDVHAAGSVVGLSLRRLHWLGLGAGTLFLLLTAASQRLRQPRALLVAECGLILLMLALTAYSQFSILPRMEQLRALGSTLGPFAVLHRRSEAVEGAVLLLGVAVLLLTGGFARPAVSRP